MVVLGCDVSGACQIQKKEVVVLLQPDLSPLGLLVVKQTKGTKWYELVLWKEESSSWGADSSEEEDEDPSLAI